jgi:hypothetical protein
MPPYPGQAYSSSSIAGVPQTAFPSYGGYGGSQVGMPVEPYGAGYGAGYGVPMSAGSAYGSMGMGISPSYSAGMAPGMAASYTGSSLGVPMYPRSRSSSFSYAQPAAYNPQPTPYMGTAMSMPVGIPNTGGQTLVIQRPRKHKHSKRSRSSDPDYDDSRSHHSHRSSRY